MSIREVIKVLRSNLPLASTQKMVQERIMCSLQMHGMAPDGMTAESALASRKGVKTDYSGVPSNWAPFDATKPLSLRFWQLLYHHSTSKSFLPVEARKLLDHPEDFCTATSCRGTFRLHSYWNPALGFNSGKRLRFILGPLQSWVVGIEGLCVIACGGVLCEEERSQRNSDGHWLPWHHPTLPRSPNYTSRFLQVLRGSQTGSVTRDWWSRCLGTWSGRQRLLLLF